MNKQTVGIDVFESLKGKDLEREGFFIAEGERVVSRLEGSGLKTRACLATPKSRGKFTRFIDRLKSEGVPVYLRDEDEIKRIVGFPMHQGIMAAVELPVKKRLSDIMPALAEGHFIAALNGVNDPKNVGLVVRNASAFGVDALAVDKQSYDPYYRKAVSVSIGTVFDLPVAYEESLARTLKWLKCAFGTRIIAASPAGARDLNATDFSGNICLILGNENEGISAEVMELADVTLRVAISDKVDSLNVACTSAIIMNAAREKRR
ncbi:MAG: RNA methyltransferase [Candidatus Omnitrophota bacterium]